MGQHASAVQGGGMATAASMQPGMAGTDGAMWVVSEAAAHAACRAMSLGRCGRLPNPGDCLPLSGKALASMDVGPPPAPVASLPARRSRLVRAVGRYGRTGGLSWQAWRSPASAGGRARGC